MRISHVDSSPVLIATDRLRVEFHWLGDRFGHTISLVRDRRVEPMWRSVQTGDHGPVFQELHHQVGAGGLPMLFLSGAGGGAHWSMSVHRDEHKIRFDTAARISSPPVDRLVQYGAHGNDPPHVAIEPMPTVTQLSFDSSVATLKDMANVNSALPTTRRWQYAATIARR
jgi:hypothetical protein